MPARVFTVSDGPRKLRGFGTALPPRKGSRADATTEFTFQIQCRRVLVTRFAGTKYLEGAALWRATGPGVR